MINKKEYRKVATVYVKKGKNVNIKSSDNGKVYNALDRLEKILRTASDINKILRGDNKKKRKKQTRKSKKYAKVDKTTGMLVLKSTKYAKRAKPAKKAKK